MATVSLATNTLILIALHNIPRSIFERGMYGKLLRDKELVTKGHVPKELA